MNWNPYKNLNIRPELRYDWSFYRNGFKPFGGYDPVTGNGRYSDQLTGGLAVTYSF